MAESRGSPNGQPQPDPRGLTVRLGLHPLALPEPFADLVRQHTKKRPNLATTNKNSSWPFPGNRAGQLLHPNTIMARLRELGVDLSLDPPRRV